MGRVLYDFNFSEIEERNSDSEILKYKCPHCTNKDGNFGDIILFKNKDNSLVTNGSCNGQEERCYVVINMIQTFNCEKMQEQQIRLEKNL